MKGIVKRGRRQGRQNKRWEDNTREWTGLEFAKSQEGSGEERKMEETGCEVIRGAPTTPAVKGIDEGTNWILTSRQLHWLFS